MRGRDDANGNVEGDGITGTMQGRIEFGDSNAAHVAQLVFKRQVVEERFRHRGGIQKRVLENGIQLADAFFHLNSNETEGGGHCRNP